jgi:hypothetical protein
MCGGKVAFVAHSGVGYGHLSALGRRIVGFFSKRSHILPNSPNNLGIWLGCQVLLDRPLNIIKLFVDSPYAFH